MFATTNKLEVNVTGKISASDISNLGQFVIKNRIPTVVADPQFIDNVILDRNRYRGQYKIICTIDFPHGSNFALQKIMKLPPSVFLINGFDIMISKGISDKESLNELKVLTEFIRNIDPIKEIRWTLGTRGGNHDNLRHSLKHMIKWPASLIRTDNNIIVPGLTIDKHMTDITFIKENIGTPIKICGNVDLKTIRALSNSVSKFDVSLSQARSIVTGIKEEEKLHKRMKGIIKQGGNGPNLIPVPDDEENEMS